MKKIVLLVTLLFMSMTMMSLETHASNEIVGPSIIHKQANHILTISNILHLYSSSYGNVVVQSDEFTGYGNVLGEHHIVLKVIDGEQEYLKDVTVMVIEELGNVKAVTDQKDLHVRTEQVLTPQDIVMILQNTGYVTITATTQMMIINDTYTENADVEGQYLFEFRLINSAGDDQMYTSIINVSDSDGFFVPDIILDKPTTGLTKACIWFKAAWSKWIWPLIYNVGSFALLLIVAIWAIKRYNKKKGR